MSTLTLLCMLLYIGREISAGAWYYILLGLEFIVLMLDWMIKKFGDTDAP